MDYGLDDEARVFRIFDFPAHERCEGYDIAGVKEDFFYETIKKYGQIF